MMAGGPLKPGVGLSGLVRPPEQNCLAGRWPTQARCWLEWAGTAARTKLSSKVPGCPGSQQPFGRYPRSHLGQENPRDSRDVPISPPCKPGFALGTSGDGRLRHFTKFSCPNVIALI